MTITVVGTTAQAQSTASAVSADSPSAAIGDVVVIMAYQLTSNDHGAAVVGDFSDDGSGSGAIGTISLRRNYYHEDAGGGFNNLSICTAEVTTAGTIGITYDSAGSPSSVKTAIGLMVLNGDGEGFGSNIYVDDGTAVDENVSSSIAVSSIASTDDAIFVGLLGCRTSVDPSPTPGTGYTEEVDQYIGGAGADLEFHCIQEIVTGSSTQDVDWTSVDTPTTYKIAIGCCLQEEAGAGGGATPHYPFGIALSGPLRGPI